jgi:hypothetical protein
MTGRPPSVRGREPGSNDRVDRRRAGVVADGQRHREGCDGVGPPKYSSRHSFTAI